MGFVRPKLHLAIACRARKAHALRQQPAPQAAPPRVRRQEEQPQLGRVRVKPDTKDAANTSASRPCHPTAFAPGIVICKECVSDSTHKGAESVIKPFITRIKKLMLFNQPIAVLGLKLHDFDVIHPRSLPQTTLAFQVPLR